jgi:hypothetical protein
MHLMHYNFARIHRTLRATPATAAEVTVNDWDIGEIVDLIHTRLFWGLGVTGGRGMKGALPGARRVK